MVKLTKQQAIERLEQQIQQIGSLAWESSDSPAFRHWERDTLVAIRYIFGEQSHNVTTFDKITYWSPLPSLDGNDEAKERADFREGLDDAREVLSSMVQEIREYWGDEMTPAPSTVAAQNESGQAVPTTRDVFIVHGHDDGLKETVARFLQNLGLTPIILHEKADQGQTIIEKFQAHADASYAVALFTPDDWGESVQKVKTLDDLRHRARQNVVLELGYFVGRLGRSRACALVKGEIELPSDWAGVLYIRVDDGMTWRVRLFQELQAAGFDVDMNRAFR